ncbi:MAG TPA: ABC transporter ATP-binding protein [Bacteroidales bacterium]|nr:ABC transporter ATP-binding protein [Bacteroidales bacterium]
MKEVINDIILEVNNVSYSVREKNIIEDISFTLEKGGFYSVIGTNGSGKTTLLRCISNSIQPTKGSVKVNNKLINKYTPKLLAHKISVVSQHSEFLFDFSSFQVVMMGRMAYQKLLQTDSEQDMTIVEQCMKKTNTWHLKDRSVKQLSGGELQRVMIARALAQQTPIILLDEPVSSLDIHHQFEIMELLTKINKENNTTIFIILHDLTLALKYSDQILALKDGRLIYFGKTKEILTQENIQELFNVRADIIDNKHIIIHNNESI